MGPKEPQFPKSLRGFESSNRTLPGDINSFSHAALPGRGVSHPSNGVRVIDREKDTLGINMHPEAYNAARTDLTNMRKSGQAAAHDAAASEFQHSVSPLKKEKKTIKVRSN